MRVMLDLMHLGAVVIAHKPNVEILVQAGDRHGSASGRYCKAMMTLKFRGKWNSIRAKLKQNHPDLTDADLNYAEGQEEELFAHLQRALCLTEEEVRQEIERL